MALDRALAGVSMDKHTALEAVLRSNNQILIMRPGLGRSLASDANGE